MTTRYARRHYRPQADHLTALEARKPFKTGLRLALGWELGQLAVKLAGAAIVAAAVAATIYGLNRYGPVLFGN